MNGKGYKSENIKPLLGDRFDYYTNVFRLYSIRSRITKMRWLIQNGKAIGNSGQRNPHPLLLLFCADIAPNVCPWDIFRPPDGLAAFFTPAWFSPTCGVLQHLWNKCPKLGLENKSVVISSHERHLGCVWASQPILRL